MSLADHRATCAGAFALCLLLACSSPEEQFEKRLSRADKLAADGNTEKAILEYRSALEIDPESAEVNEKLGEVLLRSGDLNGTFYLSEAIRIDPNRADLAMRLAGLLLASDQIDSAEAVIDAVLQQHPDDPQVHITRSELFLYKSDPDKALESATHATDLDPKNPAAWFQQGRVHQGFMRMAQLEKNQPQVESRALALAAFEKADELAGGHVMARVERARLLGLRRADEEQAWKMFQEAVELAKLQQNSDLHTVTAEATNEFAVRVGRPSMRIWALREMVAADNSRLEAWLQLVALADEKSGLGIAVFGELLAQRPDDVAAHLAYVNYLANGDKLKLAFTHLQEVIDRDLGSPLPWELLVRLQMQMGRMANARASFVRMSDEFPDSPVMRRAEARIALAEGRADDSAAILRGLEIPNEIFETQRLLAAAEHRLGNLDAATAALNRALASRTGFAPDAMRLKLAIHHDSEQWQAVLRVLASLQKHRAEITPDEQVMGVRAMYALDRGDEGREILEKLLAGENPPAAAAVEYARREGATNAANAVRYLGVILRHDPANADALEALVLLQLRSGRTQQALARINRVINSGQAKPATLLLRARVLTKAGELNRAEADALRAFEADPALPGGIELLYAIYKAQGRLDEARASFEEAEAAGVLHSGARLLLGRIYSRQGDEKKAREMLERVLRDDPTAISAKNDLAYLLAKNDTELERAVKLAEDAQRAMASNPNTADTLGYVYLRQGLNDAALLQFRNAIRLSEEQSSDPTPTLHYHLGLTLQALDRDAEAADAFEKALALDSDFPEASDARRLLKQARQNAGGPTSPS